MNYRRIYNELIMKAWRRGGVEGYKEKHHIIPRCQGGGNDKANLVELTAAEHYIAHLLLMKMYPSFHKLTLPVLLMGKKLGRGLNNKLYERARIFSSRCQMGKVASAKTRAKMSASRMGKSPGNKGVKHSDELRAKMSAVRKGNKKVIEHLSRLTTAKKGIPLTEEHKAKIGSANRGRKMSEEARAKNSAAKKGNQHALGTKRTPESIARMRATKAKNKERKELLQFWCAL